MRGPRAGAPATEAAQAGHRGDIQHLIDIRVAAPADRRGDPYDLVGFRGDAPADRRGDPYDLGGIERGAGPDRRGDPYDLTRFRAAGVRTPRIPCTTGASCLGSWAQVVNNRRTTGAPRFYFRAPVVAMLFSKGKYIYYIFLLKKLASATGALK